MKSLIAALTLTVASFSAMADTAELNDIALERELESVTKITTTSNNLETHRLDNRKGFVLESSRQYYLVTTHRKIRSWDIIKLDRSFSSISRSDVKICERNAGSCFGAGVKGFYKLGDKAAYEAFKASLDEAPAEEAKSDEHADH